MNSPEVSIIILNWNGVEDTIECLESLKKITYPNYEVIVVDNASEGDDVKILREKFGDYVHIIENDRNYGFAEGNNIGIRYALANLDPNYVLLLNNDTVVDRNVLVELVKAAEGDPSIGIAGAKIYHYDEPTKIWFAGGTIDWWRGKITPIGGSEIDKGQFDAAREVDWVSGCALLIKQKTIERIGLLHVEYFVCYEDTEWCAQARKAGYKVLFVPEARVWHKGGATIGRIDRFALYYLTRNRFLLIKRNSSKLQFLSFFIYSFLGHFLLTPVLLLVQQRDLKLLARYYKAICDGISLGLKA